MKVFHWLQGIVLFIIFASLPIFLYFSPTLVNSENLMLKDSDSYYFVHRAHYLATQFKSQDIFGPSRSLFYPDRFMIFYDGGLIYSAIYILLQKAVINVVLAYNLMIPVVLGLAGLTMYFTVFKLTRNKFSAFVSGFLFSYNPISVSLYWAPNLLSGYALIPLMIHILIGEVSSKKSFSFSLATILFVIVGLASVQVWMMSALLIFGFIIFQLLHRRYISARSVSVSYLLSAIILSPLLIYHSVYSNLYDIHRDLGGIIAGSLKLWEIPHWFIPYCKSIGNDIATSVNPNIPCSTNEYFWLGISLTGLMVIMISYLLIRRKNVHITKENSYLLTLFLLFLFFAFGPIIKLNSTSIFTPYYLLFIISPLNSIRIPSRFLYFNIAILCIWIGLLVFQFQKLTNFKKIFLLVILIALIAYSIESRYRLPPNYKRQPAPSQQVWKELSKPLYSKYILFPISPFTNPEQPNPIEATEFFEQLVHQKATVWGYPGFMSEASRNLLEYLLFTELKYNTIKGLALLDIDTIVVNKKTYHLFELLRDIPGLIKTYEDETYLIYSINLSELKPVAATPSNLSFECIITSDNKQIEDYPNYPFQLTLKIYNNSTNPFVQKKPQEKVQLNITTTNRHLNRQSSYLQLPFLIPPHSYGYATTRLKRLPDQIKDTTLVGSNIYLTQAIRCSVQFLEY